MGSYNQLLILFLLPVILPANSLCLAKEKSEDSYGIFSNQDEYYQFMGSVKREGANNPELMSMVPLLNDIVLGQPIGSTGRKYNATDSTLGLLADESVRKELEIVDQQFEDLQKANEEIQQRVAQQLRELDLTDMKAAANQILAIRDQSEKDLQSTLLPHQMQRLRQIVAQNQLRRKSFVEWLTSEPWKTQLEISDDQAISLKESEKQIEEDLQREIAALREKARKQLLGKLKNKQQQQVEELFGDDFQFSDPESKERTRKLRGRKK